MILGRHDNGQVLSVPPDASGTDLKLQADFTPSDFVPACQSASKVEASRDFWQMRACPDASQDLSDYDALDPLLNESLTSLESPLASSPEQSRSAEQAQSLAAFRPPMSFTPTLSSPSNDPSLEGQAPLTTGSPSLETGRLEPFTSGCVQKARERNKKAQRTFRQRQKAKAQQQEEELVVATSRISELEDQVATFQQLLAADLQPVGGEAPSLQLPAPGDNSLAARICASTCALQLDTHLLICKEQQLHQLQQKQLDIRTEVLAARQNHMQSLKPCAAWEGCTPVPMEDLYSGIFHGRLDLRLPLANARAPDRAVSLSRLVAMPVKLHLQLQGQYHACLAKAAPFCADPNSTHGKHFQAVMGEAMALLAVFSECLPEQFMTCQSVSMLDGTTKMPQQAFDNVKKAVEGMVLTAEQLTAVQVLCEGYHQQVVAIKMECQQQLAALHSPASSSGLRCL
ncbi:hypothetical protein WJX74_002154 [Apatococcus lobatus]|uniref:BZIP domain-containing protein n=2 Tax=Apatococcus TaxID=904362 RepID=A0AAW1STV3_9CHLO